jgi:hypothetical protein
MSSHLDNGFTERSNIEREISGCNFSLKRISEERVYLAVRLAERDLIRRLLVTRRSVGRTARSVERRSNRRSGQTIIGH